MLGYLSGGGRRETMLGVGERVGRQGTLVLQGGRRVRHGCYSRASRGSREQGVGSGMVRQQGLCLLR